MRAVAQRVWSASVVVDGETVGAIERGLLVYLGVGEGDGDRDVTYVAVEADDSERDLAWMAGKVPQLRVFPDDSGRMSRSVSDVGGAVLVVSQFTLFGDVRRGRRPSFDGAAPPEVAEALCERVVERLRGHGLPVETGRFRAMMEVRSAGDGPVTILVDSRKTF